MDAVNGARPRWGGRAVNGPFADYAARLGGLYRNIAASTTEHRVWDSHLIAEVEAQRRKILPEKDLGSRGAWRDRRMMALARHRREMDEADARASSPIGGIRQ